VRQVILAVMLATLAAGCTILDQYDADTSGVRNPPQRGGAMRCGVETHCQTLPVDDTRSDRRR
jgi:hypothetical protein